MAVKIERGIKRTCQNEKCGARFYDLMRDPIACPICHSAFLPPPVQSFAPKAAAKKDRNAFHRPNIRAVPAAVASEEGPELEPAAAGDADDVETKIESEDTDAILELEEEDEGAVIVDPSVTESEKGEGA